MGGRVIGGRRIRWATIVSMFWFVANGLIGGGAAAQSTSQASWTDQDIGNPAIAGSASSNTSGFTITAGGSDIWGTSDQFHFVYQQVSGDVDVRARVDSLTYAAAWSKAGVMIRGSLAPDAAHAFALASAGRGTAFQRRTLAGGLSTNTAGADVAPPQWVRLVRQGNTLTAYTSDDGVTWTMIGSDTVQLPAVTYVGLAVTSHAASATTTASISEIAVQPLTPSTPNGEQDADIGAPDIAGSMTDVNGTYQIEAGGADIWGTADQFNYVYQPVSGDVDVSVRIDSITFADQWSKAGVMIRETLDAASAHASALVSAGRGFVFQRRPVADQDSVSTSGGDGAAPAWLRLKRNGSLITAYQSSDGSTWTEIGSDSIPMADQVYVGIAVTSHNVALPTDVVADSLTINQNTVNLPPVVNITSPADGDAFTAPAAITITVNASDPQNQLTKVEFYNGTSLLGTATTAPYAFSWSSVPAGTYALTALAYDAAGLTTQSSVVTVTVAGSQGPTVSITSPADGSTFTAPATITITASASDSQNQITQVEFYNGTTLLGTATTAPYTISWTSVPAGTDSIMAVVYDSASLTAQSAVVTVTITDQTSGPPTGVEFSASSDNATVTYYQLDVFAAGDDPTTATPIASLNAGMPTPDADDNITISAPDFFTALPSGNYQLTVSAVSPDGVGQSAPIAFSQ